MNSMLLVRIQVSRCKNADDDDVVDGNNDECADQDRQVVQLDIQTYFHDNEWGGKIDGPSPVKRASSTDNDDCTVECTVH